MNTTLNRLIFSSLTLAAAFALTPVASAADCAAPKGAGEVRACAAAAQGVTELRRFVARTQPIYLFSVAEFADAMPARVAVAESGPAVNAGPVRLATVE